MLILVATASAESTPAVSGWEAVQAADGLGIAVTGTLIVFTALTAISLFIGVLPRVLQALGPWLPEIESHHDAPPPVAGASAADETARLAAAIGWATHRSRGG